MTCVFLSLALLAQIPALEAAREIEFTRIEIDWIIESTHPHNLDHVLPWRSAALIRQLDCKSYECRALARDEIVGMGRKAIPLLLWGTRIKDRPTVAIECNRLISSLCVCEHCQGVGRIYDESYDRSYKCPQCTGTGDLRYTLHCWFDGENWQYDVEPRDFFGKP